MQGKLLLTILNIDGVIMKILMIFCTLMVNIAYADINDAMSKYMVTTSNPKSSNKITVKPQKKNKKFDIRGSEFDWCFNVAGVHYNVPPNLLRAIATVESKMRPDAINYNRNGSYDVGVMQINSTWLPMLSRAGIQRGELLDPCKNIQIGAWILSQNVKRYGLTPEAIGRYNSSSVGAKNTYIYKVFKAYKDNRNQLLAER